MNLFVFLKKPKHCVADIDHKEFHSRLATICTMYNVARGRITPIANISTWHMRGTAIKETVQLICHEVPMRHRVATLGQPEPHYTSQTCRASYPYSTCSILWPHEQ